MPSSFDSNTLKNTETRLHTGSKLKGTLKFQSSLRISAYLEGTIQAAGFLFIEKDAEIVADIFGTDIVVAGTVRGNIEASGKLELLETGKIYGNVRAAKLRIADGVVFEGRCEMIKNSDAIDIFSAPLQELKEMVQEK